ncbi:hypothetical protein FWF48_04305 [Candidatus Saccharibacteria bacterium]|nr:hypothetical protein [Candidatus Saccharibacteria bacterium]
MENIILVLSFFGAYLLFYGSILQASQNLREEDNDLDKLRAHFKEIAANAPPAPHVSNWWWLLPPIKIVLARRRNNTIKNFFAKQLDADEIFILQHYKSRVSAWATVAGGSWLLVVAAVLNAANIWLLATWVTTTTILLVTYVPIAYIIDATRSHINRDRFERITGRHHGYTKSHH